MQQPTAKQILNAATYLGYCMLRSGAEISRVEDTVYRICTAYGIEEAHVFALSSTIIITVQADGETQTQTRRIRSIETNLDRVDALNALSRRMCMQNLPYDTVMEEIERIENRPQYPAWVSVAAYAVISGAFAVFFGGRAADCAVAFCIGFFVRLVMLLLTSLHAAPLFITAAASAATAMGAYASGLLFGGLQTETITIGILMNLVPGVALTNSIRDFIATDYMSGMSRMAEAFFFAAAIALGAAVVLLWR